VGSELLNGGCFDSVAALIGEGDLAEGLKGWINHAETIASNLPPSLAFATSTSVDEFQNALDSGELTALTTNCRDILTQASGAGICTCGSGDNGPPIPIS